MPTKYKNILTEYKQGLSIFEKRVHNNLLTNHENTQNAIDAMAKYIEVHMNSANDEEKLAGTVDCMALKAIIDDMNGKILHIFIKDEGLVEFLKTTKVKEFSLINEYIRENEAPLQEETLYKLFKNEPDDHDVHYFYLAIHTEKEAYVFYYSHQYDSTDDKTITVIGVLKSGNGWFFNLEGDYKDAPLSSLAVNLLYYMKAFPEKVFDGVPQDMVKNDKQKFVKTKCVSVGIADEIVEKSEVVNGHLVSPHFRSGFFRHYTDDRYINMKGKVQFIAATMVKGKAKTVVA